jgi:hypothetical protein
VLLQQYTFEVMNSLKRLSAGFRWNTCAFGFYFFDA